MKSFRNLPQRMPRDDREWALFLTALAEMDIRNDNTDFADGLQVDESGNAVLGDNARIDTRTDTNIKTIVSRIGDSGRALNQSLLPPVNRANGSSVQTSAPLTTTDTGSAITVNVAAHTLATDTGNVSYNSGSIAGLNYDTTYYLYTDDPELEGGAVTYLAATSPATVVSDPDFYYVGSITTPREAAAAGITNATQTDPVVVTASNSLLAGDEVDIDGITGMTELNGNRYTVANPTAANFELAGVDGTGFGAYVSGGTATLFTESATGGGGGAWQPE
jgi:hypothetical protein